MVPFSIVPLLVFKNKDAALNGKKKVIYGIVLFSLCLSSSIKINAAGSPSGHVLVVEK